MCNEYHLRVRRGEYDWQVSELNVPINWIDAEPNRPLDRPFKPTNRATMIRAIDPADPKARVEGLEARWWMAPFFHKGPCLSLEGDVRQRAPGNRRDDGRLPRTLQGPTRTHPLSRASSSMASRQAGRRTNRNIAGKSALSRLARVIGFDTSPGSGTWPIPPSMRTSSPVHLRHGRSWRSSRHLDLTRA